MSDMLADGAVWLEGQRQEYMVRSIVIIRGEEDEEEEIEVDATVGRTVFEVVREYGVETWEARDFLVAVEVVDFGEGPELPERGWRIIEIVNEKEHVYQVMAPEGEPCWRYSDLYRQALRIHTKEIEVRDVGS